MRVAIDIQRLHPLALKRGIGFYTKELFNTLTKLKDKNEYFLVKQNLDKQNIDLVHYPYFDPFFLTLPLIKTKPTIVTIHDLTPLKFPENYKAGVKGLLKLYLQKLSLMNVRKIITDSNNSKKDINKILHIPEDKIEVVYLACNSKFKKLKAGNWQKIIKQKYRLPSKYLLYVGDLNWNKNIRGLIKAFYSIRHPASGIRQKKDLKLVLVGSAFEDNNLVELNEIKKIIAKLKLETKINVLGFVPTTDLVKIYNLAKLYIQPSFYEGFGLPVLEALSCGCPVLCSDKASLPEIGGKAVEYFNPENLDKFKAKLKTLIVDNKKLEKLSLQGLNQAKKFSWKKTAIQTRNVYERVFNQNK